MTDVVALGFVVLLILATGVATYRAWAPAGSASDPILALFSIPAVGILVISWLGFSLVQSGHFSLPLLLGLTGVYIAVTLVWAPRRESPVSMPRVDRSSLFLLLLILVTLIGIARPFEWVLGGRDPGIYVNAGALIAQSGSAVQADPVAGSIPDDAAASFFGPWDPDGYWRVSGFPFVDETRQAAVFQFFLLLPTWFAILNSLGGVMASLWVTPLFGLMGVLAVYVAGRTILGHSAGLIGAFLLSINLSQVWYSRFPTAETLSQFLLFGGLAFFAVFMRTRRVYWGVLAAASLGELYLARVDMLLVPAAIVAVAVWEAWNRRLWKGYLVFGAVHLVFLGQALAYALGPGLQYTRLSLTGPFGDASLAGVGTATVAACAMVVAWGFTRVGRQTIDGVVNRRTLTVVSAAIVSAAVYAYFIRPEWQLPDLVPTAARAGDYDAETFVRIGWYVSPLGLGFGVTGLVLGLFRRLRPATALFFLIACGYSLMYGTKAMISPDHFWAIRRFVPVTIPCLLLFSGYAISELGRLRRPRFVPIALAGGLFAAMIAYSLYTLAPVWPFVEMRGAMNEIERLSLRMDENAVILFENADTGNYASVPLRYLYGRQDVFVLQPSTTDDDAVAGVIRGWWDEGRTVLLLASGTTLSLPGDRYSFEALGREYLRFSQFEHRLDRLPRSPENVVSPIDIYRVLPQPDDERAPAIVDVGGMDYEQLSDGFYPLIELSDGTTLRWTRPTASAELAHSQPREIALRLASGRLDETEKVPVTVKFNDVEVGRLEVSSGLNVYTLPIEGMASQTDGPFVVRLDSEAWALNGVALGIQVDWIELR